MRPPVSRAESPVGISAADLSGQIDQFLASRGFEDSGTTSAPIAPPPAVAPEPPSTPVEFVCEEDVRKALKAQRTLVIGERTIVTPSARELGEAKRVFVEVDWRQTARE